MKNPILIQNRIAEIQVRINSLQGYIDACTEEQMRIQDIYIQGEEFNLGKAMNKWEKEKEKTKKEIEKLEKRIRNLRKRVS